MLSMGFVNTQVFNNSSSRQNVLLYSHGSPRGERDENTATATR